MAPVLYIHLTIDLDWALYVHKQYPHQNSGMNGCSTQTDTLLSRTPASSHKIYITFENTKALQKEQSKILKHKTMIKMKGKIFPHVEDLK